MPKRKRGRDRDAPDPAIWSRLPPELQAAIAAMCARVTLRVSRQEVYGFPKACYRVYQYRTHLGEAPFGRGLDGMSWSYAWRTVPPTMDLGYPLGRKMWQCEYVDGRKHGTEKAFDERGMVVRLACWRGGRRTLYGEAREDGPRAGELRFLRRPSLSRRKE